MASNLYRQQTGLMRFTSSPHPAGFRGSRQISEESAMRKPFIRLSLIILFTFTCPVVAHTYKIDPVHSQIFFTVSHMGFSNSTGALVDFAGSFVFDEEDVSKSRVEVTMQSNSVNMNDATWNIHLKGVNWFNVERYPTITFKSTEVIKTGDSSLEVTGDLTLLGTTRPVVLNVTLNRIGDLMGNTVAGFSATTIIDRTGFYMDTFAPAIGSEVLIRLEIEGIRF